MGGGTGTGPWPVGPIGKEPNSEAGKEKPAEAAMQQQKPFPETIQKPAAAAPSNEAEILIQLQAQEILPTPRPTEGAEKDAPHAAPVKERTLDELKADRAERKEAIERLAKETSEKLDELQSTSDEVKKKCADTVKTLEIRLAGETSRLDSKRDSEIGNIEECRAEHIAEAAKQRDEEKENAEKVHADLKKKIEGERDSAVKEVEMWYSARAYELDPKNNPDSLVSDVVTDPRLVSVLKTEQAEPMGSEFLALEMGAIQKRRAERLKQIENDFDSHKSTIDAAFSHKVAVATEAYGAIVKDAEETAANEKKAVLDAYVAELTKLKAETEAAIGSARVKADDAVIAVTKRMEEVKSSFASCVAVLKNINLPVPDELKKKESAEHEMKDTPSGVQEDAVPLAIAGKPETYEEGAAQVPFTKPADEEAEAELAELARRAQSVKKEGAAPSGRHSALHELSYESAVTVAKTVGTISALAVVAGLAFVGFGGLKSLPRFTSAVQEYASPVTQNPITSEEMRRTADKLAAIKAAKNAPKITAVKPVVHIMTQQERRQLAERVAAIKAAREARNADIKFSKALNGFERRIATMKNQKGGFLYLGKGSVSYAREIAVMLEAKGKTLGVKQKNRISDLLSKKDMSRKQLKALKAHVIVLLAMQDEISKDSAAMRKSEAHLKALKAHVSALTAQVEARKAQAAAKKGPGKVTKNLTPAEKRAEIKAMSVYAYGTPDALRDSGAVPKQSVPAKGTAQAASAGPVASSTQAAVAQINSIAAAGLSVKAPEKRQDAKAEKAEAKAAATVLPKEEKNGEKKDDNKVSEDKGGSKKPEGKKGPKEEPIMTGVPVSVQSSTGAAAVSNALSSQTYSASGGVKPPWMDWAAGADTVKDYVTAPKAAVGAEVPGRNVSFSTSPAAGAATSTLGPTYEDAAGLSEKIKEAAASVEKAESKKEEKAAEPEEAQSGLMIVGNTLYTYAGQKLGYQPIGTEIHGFLTKESAEAAYNAAKEAAANPPKPVEQPVPEKKPAVKPEKVTVKLDCGTHVMEVETKYGVTPSQDLCDADKPKTVYDMAADVGLMQFPVMTPGKKKE